MGIRTFMATYELFTPEQEIEQTKITDRMGLGSAVLLANARWFTRVRWIVISIFVLTGLVGSLFSDHIEALGLKPPATWPLMLAGVLLVVNVLFVVVSRRLDENSSAGKINTFSSFVYLF
ncbi:MAG: hypothetical protein DRP87_12895 [Spirochaetes bacterium]|nr:MAG: hypothetical protein DRP87_12895 [Spirochaetota bacterium]